MFIKQKLSNYTYTVFLSNPYTQQYLESTDINVTGEVPCYSYSNISQFWTDSYLLLTKKPTCEKPLMFADFPCPLEENPESQALSEKKLKQIVF